MCQTKRWPRASLEVAQVNGIPDRGQRERAARMLLAIAHELPTEHELKQLANFQLSPEGYLSGVVHQ